RFVCDHYRLLHEPRSLRQECDPYSSPSLDRLLSVQRAGRSGRKVEPQRPPPTPGFVRLRLTAYSPKRLQHASHFVWPRRPGKFVADEVHTYQSPLSISCIGKNRWTQ